MRRSLSVNLADSPGRILALCLSAWTLWVVVLAVLNVKDVQAVLKTVSYMGVAWLAKDRIDAVVHTWEGAAGWHRAVHLFELFVVASLVVLGIDSLVDWVMLR